MKPSPRHPIFTYLSRFAQGAVALNVCLSCGASATPVREPVRLAPPPAVEEYRAEEVPNRCEGDDQQCLPPAQWVRKLCDGVHADVALKMFRGGSRWQRLYSRSVAPAFNGVGGPSVSEERIGKNEELIALQRHGDADGDSLSVGNTAGYDLLRWNGSCVTLHDGEFRTKPPRRTTHSRVEWRWLGDDVREALQSDQAIHKLYVARRKACRGSNLGSVTSDCQRFDRRLVDAIVDYVRDGGSLDVDNRQAEFEQVAASTRRKKRHELLSAR